MVSARARRATVWASLSVGALFLIASPGAAHAYSASSTVFEQHWDLLGANFTASGTTTKTIGRGSLPVGTTAFDPAPTATVPGSSRGSAPTPEYATQVGYIRAPINSSFIYEVDCDPVDRQALTGIAFADGVHAGLDFMSGGIHYHPRRTSGEGQIIQVADQRFESVPRKESGPTDWGRFSFGSNGGFAGGTTGYAAWALWGNTATCTAVVNGKPVEVHYLDGSHALYAGPESFTGGIYYQDGATHAAAGRLFTKQLSGGPVFAWMDHGKYGAGFIQTDDPYPLVPIGNCATFSQACNFARPAANVLVAGLAAAFEQDPNGAEGELIEIDLPPD